MCHIIIMNPTVHFITASYIQVAQHHALYSVYIVGLILGAVSLDLIMPCAVLSPAVLPVTPYIHTACFTSTLYIF